MPVTNLAKNASERDAQTILFGLLADGSGRARFAGVGGPSFRLLRAASEPPRFSPSRDWYDRWAVRPLHGTLMQDTRRMEGGVCPDDIVVLKPCRHTRCA